MVFVLRNLGLKPPGYMPTLLRGLNHLIKSRQGGRRSQASPPTPDGSIKKQRRQGASRFAEGGRAPEERAPLAVYTFWKSSGAAETGGFSPSGGSTGAFGARRRKGGRPNSSSLSLRLP